MILRRHIDDAGPMSRFRGSMCACLLGLWLITIPLSSFASEWYEPIATATDDLFRDVVPEEETTRSTTQPWFLHQTIPQSTNPRITAPHENQCRRCSKARPCPQCRRCTPARRSDAIFDDCNTPACLPPTYCQQPSRPCDPCDLKYHSCPVHRLSFRKDLHDLPKRWRADIHAIATCENAFFLGTFAAGAAILRNNVDEQAAQNIQENGPYWGNVSDVIEQGGNSFTVQLPLLAGVYALSLYHQDDDLHELSLTMLSSFNFTVISSLSLQYLTGTHRPNNATVSAFGDSGFPSTPVATSFALAAVLDERYGWRGGLPAYLTAGLIGWSEIDQNQHRVSDVVFGAALGYAIGKSIGAMHYRPDSPFKLVPFADPWSRTQGFGFERRF